MYRLAVVYNTQHVNGRLVFCRKQEFILSPFRVQAPRLRYLSHYSVPSSKFNQCPGYPYCTSEGKHCTE